MDDSERKLNSQVKICIALTQPIKVLLATSNIDELLGFKADDFLTGNVTLQSRIHAHDQDIADVLFSTDSNATSVSINIRLRHADGRIRCIKGEYTKAIDLTGNGVTLELMLQDAKNLWQHQDDQWMMTDFAAMLDNTGDYIFFKDRNHVFTGANQTLVSAKHCQNVIGKTDYDLFSEFLADIYYSLEKRVFASSKAEYEVQEILDDNGNKGWVDNRKYPIKNSDDEIIGLFGMARNITESKKIEAALEQYKERLSLAISFNGIGIWDLNLQTSQLQWDDAMFTLYNMQRADFSGGIDAWEKSLHPDDRIRAEQEFKNAISGEMSFNTEFRIVCQNGVVRHIKAVAKVFRDENGKALRMFGTNVDITISKAAAESIEMLAFYDPLTQLPNRRLLLDKLNQALANSSRSGQRGALMFLDLDRFKTLNDTLGHSFGDLLLQQVAERLITSVRQNDTVSRIGGDEFVILLESLSGNPVEAASQVQHVAEKIINALNEPYTLNTHIYSSTPSIGIALFNGREKVPEDLLRHADIAMYESKSEGRNTLRFFDPIMQEVINTHVKMEKNLRIAIEQHQFELYYQVQVDRDSRAYAVEALIRWFHPERGIITPADFIPLAEELGLIIPIGQWVINAACLQLKAWQKKPLTCELVLAVNVSAKQFHQEDFVEQVYAAIERHRVNPALLKLELTESMLLNDIDNIVTKIRSLRSIGVQFSLDDFGTGYSSLQYLKKLPLNQLKIDKSFVRDITVDTGDRAIVRTIITMAKSFGIKVIAEGVETVEQRQCLFDEGCFHYQGYLFSKPLPIGSFEALLKKKKIPING